MRHAFLLRAVNVGGTAKLPMAELRALETAVETRFGFTREVIVRDAAALRAARDAHPFTIVDPRFSCLVPLTGVPADPRAAADVPSGDDQWALVGADLHVRYAHGAGSADLDLARLLRTLGVVGTARNLRTVDELLRLLG